MDLLPWKKRPALWSPFLEEHPCKEQAESLSPTPPIKTLSNLFLVWPQKRYYQFRLIFWSLHIILLWVKLCSPKKIGWRPNPQQLWMWLYLEMRILQMHKVIRVGPHPVWLVLMRRGKSGQRYTRRMSCGDRDRDGSDAATNQGMQRIPVVTRSKDRGMAQILPQKEPTLPAPWCWMSKLQNCERPSFCCFKPPGL